MCVCVCGGRLLEEGQRLQLKSPAPRGLTAMTTSPVAWTQEGVSPGETQGHLSGLFLFFSAPFPSLSQALGVLLLLLL